MAGARDPAQPGHRGPARPIGRHRRQLGAVRGGHRRGRPPIEVVDGRRDELMSRARRQRTRPLSFIEDDHLFGDISRDPAFVGPYLSALESFHQLGARQTLLQLNRELAPSGSGQAI